MARSSRAVAAHNHEQLVKAAARLFRQRGVEGVSLPDIMGAIGLTRGGFYKHFESKEAVLTAAIDTAFAEHMQRLALMAEQSCQDRAATRTAFVDFCLSAGHRDDPANGCPSALASAIAQFPTDGAPRTAYVTGVRTMINDLAELATPDDGDGHAARSNAMVDISTIVGAVLLARATAGDSISDEILTTVRQHLESANPTSQSTTSD